MQDCIFCKIDKKELPARVVYQDADIFAFEDLHPQAPMHLLVCPRKHMESLADAQPSDAALLGRLLLVGQRLAEQRGHGGGHRTVFNTGAQAGQSVFHLHLHVLGGRSMRWPPG
jgi:histidine triad (HIT) family protein